MLVFLNGRLVPEAEAVVSVFDRSFLYGDGLFETLRVMNGMPLDWGGHWRRLASGAETLKLKLPFTSDFLRAQARELSRQNQLPEAILRLTLSRGVGPRGYSPGGADTPTLVMALHPAPPLGPVAPQWKLHTASLRVPPSFGVHPSGCSDGVNTLERERQTTAGSDSISTADACGLSLCKTANKLLHVLARAEAEAAGADDALLLNVFGEVAESTSANLFWIEGGELHTPPLTAGALPGVTRASVLAWARAHALLVHETSARPERLRHAEGCFLTLSSLGIVEVVALDRRVVPNSPLIQRIRDELLAAWRTEAGLR